MSRFRIYVVLALAVALVALSGPATPAATSASSIALHCESTGGGAFACDAATGGSALYSWKAGSNAVITQYLGSSVRGNCTVGTTADVSVASLIMWAAIDLAAGPPPPASPARRSRPKQPKSAHLA